MVYNCGSATVEHPPNWNRGGLRGSPAVCQYYARPGAGCSNWILITSIGGLVRTDQSEHRLAIVGGGVMGTNIATLATGYGIPVTLIDVSDAVLAAARSTIAQKLRHAQLMGALPPGLTPG